MGTSGWVYRDWCGLFYPPDLPAKERLRFYTEHFDTVEINSTFYRLASLAGTATWQRTVPRGFRFVAKGSQFITHRLKLRDCERAVARFFERLEPLSSLRAVLWQLPESFPRDVDRVDAFLAILPEHVRHALELRDPWWWDEPRAREVLERHRVAFCAVSHPALPPDVIPTTDFLYVRFHGLGERKYDYHYSPAELAEWVERLKAPMRGRETYVFFNNDYHCQAIDNAKTFAHLLESRARRTA